jgi:hypothetical protein
MGDESVRWTVVVDKETDRNVRMRLAERGMKKGDLSKFIKDAVNRDLFMQTVAEVREGFKDMSSEEIESLVDDAVAWARGGGR